MIRYWTFFTIFALATVMILSARLSGPGSMEAGIALIALSAVLSALFTRWIKKRKYRIIIALFAVIIPQFLFWGVMPFIWKF